MIQFENFYALICFQNTRYRFARTVFAETERKEREAEREGEKEFT
jgi:hypothetical protein